MSDHLIAEANRHAKALPKMTLPTTKPNDRDLSWYFAECLRIARAEINELKVKAGFYEREIARLRADKERLDWLEKYGATPICSRAAIDAARKEAQP